MINGGQGQREQREKAIPATRAAFLCCPGPRLARPQRWHRLSSHACLQERTTSTNQGGGLRPNEHSWPMNAKESVGRVRSHVPYELRPSTHRIVGVRGPKHMPTAHGRRSCRREDGVGREAFKVGPQAPQPRRHRQRAAGLDTPNEVRHGTLAERCQGATASATRQHRLRDTPPPRQGTTATTRHRP